MPPLLCFSFAFSVCSSVSIVGGSAPYLVCPWSFLLLYFSSPGSSTTSVVQHFLDTGDLHFCIFTPAFLLSTFPLFPFIRILLMINASNTLTRCLSPPNLSSLLPGFSTPNLPVSKTRSLGSSLIHGHPISVRSSQFYVLNTSWTCPLLPIPTATVRPLPSSLCLSAS